MLYVINDKDNTTLGAFHVGETPPRLRDRFYALSVPVRIQADGDELYAILRQCKGIRTSTSSVVIWTGEDARFIFNNLRL